LRPDGSPLKVQGQSTVAGTHAYASVVVAVHPQQGRIVLSSPFLVGAYGMFWDRWSVEWRPGSGAGAWQLLGRVHTNRPKLRFCDFRNSQGFYILFDEHGANYVGLARGQEGLGARLQAHSDDARKTWSRFCWFSFDSVRDASLAGWSEVDRREMLRGVSAEVVLQECEALLIQVLGSARVVRHFDTSTGSRGVRLQSEMAFKNALKWEQVRDSDFQPGERARRVDARGFTDPWLKSLVKLTGDA
jgi:hypothetical protein